MKKNKIRILALLLALAMLTMVACGQTNNNTPSQSSDNNTTTQTPENDTTTNDTDDGVYRNPAGVELKPVTIDFRLANSEKLTDIGRISEAVNQHLAELGKPYSVNLYIHEYGEYWDNTINLLLSTGEPIDALFIAGWAGDFRAQANAGTLRPLNDLLEAYPEIEEILSTDFMHASRVNGIQYGVPVNKEQASSLGWVVRKDIADAMGMDINSIHSTADIEPWLYKAHEEHDMWLILSDEQPLDAQWDIVGIPNLSVDPFSNSNEIVARQLHPKFIEAVKHLSKWNEDGLMNRNTTPETTVEGELMAGKTWATIQQLKPGKDGEMSGALGMELVQIETVVPRIATGDTIGAMVAIPANAPNPYETMDFISLLYTDKDLINLIIFGQEGVDFEFIDQSRGIVKKLESGWNMAGSGWTLGNQLNNYVTEYEDPDKWQKFQAFNESSEPLASLGFVADTSDPDVQTWIANITATLGRYRDLVSGFVPVDKVDSEFDKLRAELEASGLNEYIAVVQEQYDAWRAAQ